MTEIVFSEVMQRFVYDIKNAPAVQWVRDQCEFKVTIGG